MARKSRFVVWNSTFDPRNIGRVGFSLARCLIERLEGFPGGKPTGTLVPAFLLFLVNYPYDSVFLLSAKKYVTPARANVCPNRFIVDRDVFPCLLARSNDSHGWFRYVRSSNNWLFFFGITFREFNTLMYTDSVIRSFEQMVRSHRQRDSVIRVTDNAIRQVLSVVYSCIPNFTRAEFRRQLSSLPTK